MNHEVMCPYCGEMISDKATVCRHCGRLLTGSVQYDADGTGVWYGDVADGHTGEDAARLRRKSKRNLWLVILLCIGVMIAMIAAFTFLMVDLVNEHSDELDDIINTITETGELPESVLPDGSDDIADLPEGLLPDQFELISDYADALQKNDREAAASLFHPFILEAYDGDAAAMLHDMDEHFSLYGANLTGWKTVDSGEVDQEDLDQLNAALPVGIENAEVHLIELTPASGNPIEVYLLLVQTAEGWSLYYSY